jgi:hypothetical protein
VPVVLGYDGRVEATMISIPVPTVVIHQNVADCLGIDLLRATGVAGGIEIDARIGRLHSTRWATRSGTCVWPSLNTRGRRTCV